MNLDLTEAGVADLQSIRNYTVEKWGPEQEQVYLNAIWSKFEDILSDPQGWRFRNDLFPACQIAAQGQQVILFRMQGKSLQIVRILHSAMDFPRHLARKPKQ